MWINPFPLPDQRLLATIMYGTLTTIIRQDKTIKNADKQQSAINSHKQSNQNNTVKTTHFSQVASILMLFRACPHFENGDKNAINCRQTRKMVQVILQY